MIDPARSFGRVAEQYELGRPSWPPAVIDMVERHLGLGPGATVLDLGAGTGKLTRLLVERFAHVIAVEPLETMRALVPDGAEALVGDAESIPLPDGSVTAVFCGESFHWFDWPRAIAEIVRVLEPRGGLVLMWNRPGAGSVAGKAGDARRVNQDAYGVPRGLSSGEWPQGVRDALDRLVDPSPPERRYRSFAWRDALAGSPFEELRFEVIPNGGVLDRERLLARIGSWSQVAALPGDEREAFLTEVAGYLTEPEYPVTLETHLYWTRLAA